jgi:hypothetical protein
MKRLTALLISLALMALTALPAFAQGSGSLIQIDLDEQNNSGISGTATLEDQGDGTTRVDLVLEGVEEKGAYPAHIHAGQCPEPGEITYPLESVVFNANAGAGVSVTILEASIDEILAVQSAINVHLFSDPSVYVACGNLPMAGGDKQVPDNQQDGGKDSGAGDDQQDDGTGAGDDQKTPDNQQGGGGDTVTKTFELTLNGTVPEDAGFIVSYLEEGDDPETGGAFIILCADISRLPAEQRADIGDVEIISDEACEGDGTVYRIEREFERGTRLAFFFARASVTDEDFFEIFHTSIEDPSRIDSGDPIPEDFETLDTDFTNTAWYTFGEGTGAGDDQQDDDKDTGAGDDQQTPDNQQDDADKDSGAGDEQETPDNQQGEMPGEMPDTGMGGLATGATIPAGNAAAGLTMLVGAGYAVLRRR